MNTELNTELNMGLKALAQKVLDKNRPLNMTLNSGGNPVQSGAVQIEQESPQGWQEFYDERAAVLEHDHELPRSEAEARAWAWSVTEWLNQNPAPSEPDQCAWCGKVAEVGKIVPFGAGTATWLHHVCWPHWQTHRRAGAEQALSKLIHTGGNK